ncbi:ATP synthase F1 subunit delta [Thermocoleostomius sinensis]|uniref:ATP synthase subunit delta n=1 Tax=Thermocoleostomius sinensis A174 TaxID=2016057 RepID=A0A9E9C7A5_9CYAN|nr:ATP synthase F1 subunit delta [Thermocoleostomius sinensis]WAL60139.1 ATP synthase F1 subunit delta [Thermocoleostomius sinensis A174]
MRSTLLSSEIAEPYAQALMSLARDNDLVDRISEDVTSLLSLMSESDDLRACLINPIFKAEDKKAVLNQVVREQLHPFTYNFLMILIDRGRIIFLEPICKQFQELVRQLKQTVLAEVTSAIPLSDEQQESIRQKVKGMAQAQQVELDTKIDPDLLGGVIIKVGSKIIDASLRGQLRRIGTRLTSAV